MAHYGGTDAVVAAAIIDLAHAIGLHTLGDGITHAAELAELAQTGCDYARGPYISPPAEPAAIEALIAAEPVPRTMPIDEAVDFFSRVGPDGELP